MKSRNLLLFPRLSGRRKRRKRAEGKSPVTLKDIEEWIAEREESLRWIALPDYEEYDFDISKREDLDEALREYGDQPLPQALTELIARADQHFRDITKDSEDCVWSDSRKYDRERYWYDYRWPLK